MAILAPQVTAGELLNCGIVRVEVLRGVLKLRVKTELTHFFNIVPEVPLTATLLNNAANLAWSLDRQGKILPVTDIIIAACAQLAKAELITEDLHFQKIPNLKVRAEL